MYVTVLITEYFIVVVVAFPPTDFTYTGTKMLTNQDSELFWFKMSGDKTGCAFSRVGISVLEEHYH